MSPSLSSDRIRTRVTTTSINKYMKDYNYYLSLVNERKDNINSQRELRQQLLDLDHQDNHLRIDILNQIESLELRHRELMNLTLSDDS